MLVNKQVILDHLIENPDSFRRYFPRLIDQIDQVVKKPKCGICINAFFTGLINDTGFQQKMSVVFDDPEIKFAQDIQDFLFSANKDKVARRSKTNVEVYWVSAKDAKDFIEGYTKNKLIRDIQTTYVPDLKQIMVTINWSSLV